MKSVAQPPMQVKPDAMYALQYPVYGKQYVGYTSAEFRSLDDVRAFLSARPFIEAAEIERLIEVGNVKIGYESYTLEVKPNVYAQYDAECLRAAEQSENLLASLTQGVRKGERTVADVQAEFAAQTGQELSEAEIEEMTALQAAALQARQDVKPDLVTTLQTAKFPAAQRNTGCCTTHCKPTLAEMVQSSREALETYRARTEAGQNVPTAEAVKRAQFNLAEYEILVERHGGQTKLHRVSGRDMAEARVAAFLLMTSREQNEDLSDPFPPFTPDPNRARRIVCTDGVSRPFALAPTRNDPLMDALLALNDATDDMEMAQGDYVQFRDETSRADMDAAQVEVERLQREVAGLLTPGGERKP